MPAWALTAGSTPTPGSLSEWFSLRYAHARALVPAANFDTIIGCDFEQTITSQLVDVVGEATADPVSFYNGGVVATAVGDAVIAPSSGRLELTGSPSHVGSLSGKSWYMASLVRLVRPPDAQLGDTAVDMIALWADDANTVGLGILGDASGGSTTNWVGHVTNASGTTTVLGPALDDEESPVWHLFEVWYDVDTGETHFMIDGTAFASTITDPPPALPAKLGMISRRDAVGSQSIANYDKACVVVASPAVGGID